MPCKDPVKRAFLKSASRGTPGSPERAAWNEKRRFRRKQNILPILEGARRHKQSLREFILRRVA